MRALVLVLLVACGSSADQICPSQLDEGDACAFSSRCWHADTFSSCSSGWCRCEAGKVVCDGISDGAACGDEPIDQCSVEGNPSCTTLPTSGACSCGDDGAWHCSCACYGGLGTCSIDPCTIAPQRLGGALCGEVGQICAYPGNVRCTCEEPAPGTAPTFHCQ